MKNDKVSIIIPVYNVERYLPRCIDSIINQTHENLDIILINDGSTDNSGQICDKYSALDKRVRVIHKLNEGSSCARNAGLDIANGDFITYIDSDDYVDINMIDIMLGYMAENNLNVVEALPNIKRNNNINDDNFKIESNIRAFSRVIRDSAFSVWRRIYRKKIVEGLRFIPKIIHQDVFYTVDVLNRVEKIGLINTKFYNYNTDNESIIRSKYSLNKITVGIKATEYIINNSPKNTEVQQSVNDYINHYYTDHYFLLSRNTELDKQNLLRKKLKKHVRETLNKKNCNLRSLMVAYLSSKSMEYISSTYERLLK